MFNQLLGDTFKGSECGGGDDVLTDHCSTDTNGNELKSRVATYFWQISIFISY